MADENIEAVALIQALPTYVNQPQNIEHSENYHYQYSC
jgi:hypothetical protein